VGSILGKKFRRMMGSVKQSTMVLKMCQHKFFNLTAGSVRVTENDENSLFFRKWNDIFQV